MYMKMTRKNRPLTLKEFADAVGVQYQTAWQMLATGKLNPCVDYPLGERKRVRRFDKKEVARVKRLIELGLPVSRLASTNKAQMV